MAAWGGFSDEEVSKVKLQIIPLGKIPELSQPEDDNEKKCSDDVDSTNELVMTGNQPEDHKEHSKETIDLIESDHSKSVEVLQEHQERLKQENLERKIRIENALKERCERSSKEVVRLQFVRKELSKIDGLVTQDVSVLRERIEEADKTFNKAKTRLNVAEKEYVAAKLAFYEAEERKELLSEHLCTIIRHNEARKALKLKNLMSDLQLQEDCSSEPFLTDDIHDRPKPPAGEEIPLGASMISIQRLD